MRIYSARVFVVIAPYWEEREISLDYLMSEKYFELSAMGSYFEKQDKPSVFLVLGKEVIVDDERFATALSRLPELRREVLLLYYFIGYRAEAIGRLYGRCRSTINSRRNVAYEVDGEDMDVDKDLFGVGSDMYHPDNCCILPKGLNTLLSNSKKHYRDGENPDNTLPLG